MGRRVITPVRGRVYTADAGYGRKPWLIVSNNARNTHLPTCLAARITTSPKKRMTTIIELGHEDPLAGRVLCDDIDVFLRDQLEEDRGALSPGTMTKVAEGLRAALAL